MRLPSIALCIGTVLSTLVVPSCSDYEYSSPEPGILDVRLKVINNRQDLLPFSLTDSLVIPSASMFLVMKSLYAIQPDDVELPVYSDLFAIRRNPDGDFYECFSGAARDSMVILGQTYAPPELFTGLQMLIESPFSVSISYGFYSSTIFINPVLPFIGLQNMEAEIPIESGRTTRVTVALDLDRSLIQLTESFLFFPVFYCKRGGTNVQGTISHLLC
jgi:hypothetical protein